MLQNAQRIRLDHGIHGMVIQKHPHDAALRDITVDPLGYQFIAHAAQRAFVHTGPVKAVHASDALARGRIRYRSGIHRQIATLAVSAQIQPIAMSLCRACNILRRFQLRRHVAVGHIKILFPARQRQVRAAESDASAAIVHVIGAGSKLHFALLIHHAHIIRKRPVRIARQFGAGLKKLDALAGKMVRMRFQVVFAQILPRLRKGAAFTIRHILQRRIHQLRKHQRIQSVKRTLFRRQMPNLQRMMTNVRHFSSSCFGESKIGRVIQRAQ